MNRPGKVMLLGLAVGWLVVAPAGAQAPLQKKSRDLITREEILESAQKNGDLYQIVRSLRPHFLAPPRGVRTVTGTIAPVALYVDDLKRTGVEDLRMIKPETVWEIHYLDPTKAEEEYGITHNGGAILVTLRKGG
jgi:hypothetical protein